MQEYFSEPFWNHLKELAARGGEPPDGLEIVAAELPSINPEPNPGIGGVE
jgi:hypothetical protein